MPEVFVLGLNLAVLAKDKRLLRFGIRVLLEAGLADAVATL